MTLKTPAAVVIREEREFGVNASALLELLLQTSLDARVEACLFRDEDEFHAPHLEASTGNLHATFLLNVFDEVRRQLPIQ